MFTNTDVDISEFIKITSAGVQIANFPQIRAALIERYKSVYGEDIDLSTASADGVFVNDLALIINNICMSIQTFYGNMDVDNASGIYLDNLCKLSNITRKPSTYSNASLTLTNENDFEVNVTNGMIFVDKSGTEWTYNGPTITLAKSAAETSTITVECSTPGPVKAEAGWIDQTLEVTNIVVTQTNAANIGSDEESDDELRNRRNQSTGSQGTIVIDSMIGSLLQISGIDDVLVYNNSTSEVQNADDTTSIPAHSIYVILRKQEGVSISNETIGTLIYEKLTPGISTTQTGKSDASQSYTYIPEVFGSKVTDFNQNVYWKQAIPAHDNITIKITPYAYFSKDELPTIYERLCKYLNSLPLSIDVTEQNLIIQAVYADPQFKSKATYGVGTVTIPASASTNADTYFDYKPEKCSYNQDTNTITIGG